MIINNELLQRNLIGLSAFNPKTAKKISEAPDETNVYIEESRSGKNVPYYQDHDGRKIYLHSIFDPVKEGLKISEAYNKPGAKIVFGLGGGYHLLPMISSKKITSLIIVEKDPAILKKLFQVFDFSLLFSNTRVHLLIDAGYQEILTYLIRMYLPGIHGDLEVFNLLPHTKYFNGYYQQIFPAIKDAIDIISDDFTVQSYFGKKWFKNALNNLLTASENTGTLGNIKKAAVIGAGPSLEKQIDYLKEIRSEIFCIATDTSLPCLLDNGITPDCIISIDCQHISYLHFMKKIPKSIPLILDISSPRQLSSISQKIIFFSSSHPFARYINKYWRLFPELDITGGNVSHAAVSLAAMLGAKKTYVFGIDFSYPDGKIYSKNTFIYDYFSKISSRVNSIEKQSTDIIFRNNNIQRTKTGKTIRYTSNTMLKYKRYLESYIRNIGMELTQVPGDGETIEIVQNIKYGGNTMSFFSAGNEKQTLKDFLKEYYDNLSKIKLDDDNLSDLYNRCNVRKQEIIKTVLPIVSVFIRENPDRNLKLIYRDSISWTKRQVKKLLNYL